MFVRARVFGTLGALLGFLALVPPWFRGCDLRAACQTAGATAWASDWAAPGLVAFVLPALGNGAWVILLTLHIHGSRRTRGGSGAANGAFGVPARLVRPLGRLAGALVAVLGGFVAHLTYENASETARAASAGAGAVTPRTQHVGWYLAIFANGITAFSGFVACFFGRGALCGPSKKQLSARVADDELLRVISTKPEPTQVGLTPRGERVMRLGRPAPSGEAHRKYGGAFARRQPERMEKPRSFSHASRVSERERARERAVRERAAANGGGGGDGGRQWRYGGEASGSEAGTSSGDEGTSSDESSETYEDVERGRRRAGTSARDPARVPDPAGGQGGWESWKAAFWKSSAGAAAAAASAAASAPRAAGGMSGSGSGAGSGSLRTLPGGSEPEEHIAYRAERDARAARLKSLAKSPDARAARPRASAFDRARPARTIPDASREETGFFLPPPLEASRVGARPRAREGGGQNRWPASVYELSSSDEELLVPARLSESPDSVAEARSPLLSPVVPETRGRLSGSAAEPEALSLRQRAELGRRA